MKNKSFKELTDMSVIEAIKEVYSGAWPDSKYLPFELELPVPKISIETKKMKIVTGQGVNIPKPEQIKFIYPRKSFVNVDAPTFTSKPVKP